MRWCFEEYGCFYCKKKNVLYAGNGFCRDCRAVISRRLIQIMKRRTKNQPPLQLPRPNKWLFSRAEAAEKLLGEFVKKPKQVTAASIRRLSEHGLHRNVHVRITA